MNRLRGGDVVKRKWSAGRVKPGEREGGRAEPIDIPLKPPYVSPDSGASYNWSDH